MKTGISRRSFLATGAAVLVAAGAARADGVRDVPFFQARSDLEATLACARMILSNYDRKEHFPVADVAEMLYHREGFWVFEAQLIPILAQKGFGPTLHADTPYPDLIAGSGLERYGPDAARRTDREALEWAAGALDENTFQSSPASFDQVLEWSRKGALMMLAVSRAVLRSDPGLPYCRYNIVLTGTQSDRVRYHDPSAGPHRSAPLDLIRKAYEAGPDRAVIGVLPQGSLTPTEYDSAGR
jgi:hypothetical protein